jgi:hypothetical protein
MAGEANVAWMGGDTEVWRNLDVNLGIVGGRAEDMERSDIVASDVGRVAVEVAAGAGAGVVAGIGVVRNRVEDKVIIVV